MTRLGVISDIHYKPTTHGTIVSELESLVGTFENDVEPDSIVIVGDMIHEGETLCEDRERATVVRDVLSDLSCPVRYIPGNHDVSNAPPEAYWESVYGQNPRHIDRDRSIGFLDSSAHRLDGPRGELTEAQLTELADAAAAWTNGLVFVHHPVHTADISGNRWFSDAPEAAFCGDKRRLWELLDDSPPIAATINGHLHRGGHVRHRGIDHFTIEAFNKELVRDEPYGSYGVIERDSDLTVRLVAGDGRSETHRLPLD